MEPIWQDNMEVRLIAAKELIRMLVREPSTLAVNLAEGFLREEARLVREESQRAREEARREQASDSSQ